MPRRIDPSGPPTARIMIVGEAPGADEELEGQPFVGTSGRELTRMLREVGLDRAQCYVTNVCPYRPPSNKLDAWIVDTRKKGEALGWSEHNGRWASPEVMEGIDLLRADIERIQPRCIIALGNTPLWALTGETGITKWRGSQLTHSDAALIPTYHPAAILRQWSWRHVALADLRRAAMSSNGPLPVPPWDFCTHPTFEQAHDFLAALDGRVALDIETGSGHTVCIGIATSPVRALCLPLVVESGPYWPAEQQALLLDLLFAKLESTYNIGQNFAYDAAYLLSDFARYPRIDFDTFIAQSVLWPGEPRALGFLASIYCAHYCYWKDDAKEWFKLKSQADYDRLFRYNCEDAARTWEVAAVQHDRLKDRSLLPQMAERQRYDAHVFEMSLRGVMRDPERTATTCARIEERMHELNLRLNDIAGHPINPRSSKQCADYFFRELGLPPVLVKRAKGESSVSTGDEALQKVLDRYPEHAETAKAILAYRSLGSLQSNFLAAKTEPDGRLHGGFTSCGTETYRLTCGLNAFGRGANLLNVTFDTAGINLRWCIVPDPGHLYFDCDLERADLQVVVWEANDENLKTALRDNVDIHLINAIQLYDIRGIPYDECRESHSRYLEHIERVGALRGLGKRFVHLTNYGGKARTAAIACGITVHEADLAQRRWFGLHPGIKAWHRRTEANLKATRSVMNRFGYRRTYFDRVEGLLTEALAWVPQSTVALTIAEVHRRFDAILGVEVQIQCYDSLAGQLSLADLRGTLAAMHEASRVVVPYADPLIIPLGLKIGPSWGECKAHPWPRA